jgi:hypothetical protein
MLPRLGAGHIQRGFEFYAWLALCQACGVERYVELGWGSGATAQAAKDAGFRVASVDIAPEPPGGQREGILYIASESWAPAAVARAIEHLGGPPDAVFVDADHLNGSPRRDFEAWWPHTRTLMGFHDVEWMDSGALWREVSPKHRSLEILARDDLARAEWAAWGMREAGIGILFKHTARP